MKQRLNRARIEWKPFFTASEYVLLDQILYRASLTEANNGSGYVFHVRQLARETGLSTGRVSQIISGWDFMTKQGEKKAMTIHFDATRFDTRIVQLLNRTTVQPLNTIVQLPEVIVQPLNNDCSTIEPISKREEVKESKSIEVGGSEAMQPLNHQDKETIRNVLGRIKKPSGASQKPSGFRVVSRGEAVTAPAASALSALPSSSRLGAGEDKHVSKGPLTKAERFKARSAFIESLETEFKDVPKYQRDLRIQVELAKYDQQSTKPKSTLNGFGAFN